MGVRDDLLFRISMDNKMAKEKTEIMADALNEKMPPTEGFSLVKSLRVNVKEYEETIKDLINKGSI
jgi:hypothetical protein